MSGPTATYRVQFKRPRVIAAVVAPAPGRVPRVARLLALAHRIDQMIQSGELRDLAHAAKACGVTRARVTQLMNLTLLAPAVQQAILDLPPVVTGRDPVTERHLRAVVANPHWDEQLAAWHRLQEES